MTVLARLLDRIGKRPRKRPAVIAHRGASRVAPENTVTAFEIAIESGADAVEFDVRLTADQELVVMHDARLGRTATSSRLVASVTAADVSSMDAGGWFNKAFRGELVPLVDETLSTLSGRAVPLVEIKDSGQLGINATRKLVQILEETKMTEDVIVTSLFTEVLIEVGRMSPDTPRAGVTARHVSALNAISAYDGCLTWWKSFGPDLVKAAKETGGFVAPWIVPPDKAKWFAEVGVDAIITDDPAETLRRLK